MRPIVVLDAWHEPSGPVVATPSRLLPRRVTVVRAVRRSSGELSRRTCVQYGDRLVVSPRSAPALLAYLLSKKVVDRVRRR